MNSRRDYKSAATGQHRQRARRHGLLVVTLILIGLFGGLLAYLKGSRPQPPTTAAVAPTAPAPAPSPAAPTAPPPPKATAAPVAEPEPVRPKYDFYTELPKRQIDVQSDPVKPAKVPLPTRMQPAVNQLHKPTTPRENAKAPAPVVAAANGVRLDSKTATAKLASSKSTTAKTTTFEPTHSKSTATPSKLATAKSTNPTPSAPAPTRTTQPSKSATVKSTNPTPPAPAPTRTAQPPRSLASNNSKIIVNPEQEP